MRVFAGVFPPVAVRRDVRAVLEQTASLEGVRWASVDNLHVTLMYLGNIDAKQTESAGRALEEACAGVAPFDLEIGELGAFSNFTRARVLVLKILTGASSLEQLHQRFKDALPPQLRPKEVRPYSPHFTLARCKQPPRKETLLALAEELAPLRWQCALGSVHLVASELTATGAQYEVLSEVRLGP